MSGRASGALGLGVALLLALPVLVGIAWAGLWSLVVWAVVARRRRTLRRSDH